LAQAFVKNIVATYIGRQTDCHGDILNPPSPGLMRRENNSVMSSTKNEAVVNHVKAQKTERTPLLTVARFSLWLSGPDSFLESARSDSRFRRDWFVGSRPLWPWLVAHLFIWNDKYFDQPLPQLAIDWESSSAHSYFFLERTLASRRNTIISTEATHTWVASRANAFEPIEDILNLGTTTISEVFAVRKDPGLKSAA
jgi:hypothetical protein